MNKNLIAVVLGLGLGLGAFGSNARMPVDCDEQFYWCVDRHDYSFCRQALEDCLRLNR